MRNVLITGGAGYIGSHTAKALSAAGFTPVVYDNLSTGHREAVRWGPLVVADLSDTDALVAALRDFQIEAVIHFAASALVHESMEDPHKYFLNNSANSLNLLGALMKTCIKTFVFSSTCATYGIPQALPIDEDHPQRPVNPYGESKLAVERMLTWYASAHGLRWTSLRYFNAAGADPEGEIGEDHDPETHLIPTVIDAALGEKQSVEIFGVDFDTRDGTAVRDYVHVTDLAHAHVQALDWLRNGGNNIALNLGTGNGCSVREVVAMIERLSRHHIAMVEKPRRPGDPACLVADPSRASAILSWRPGFSDLETICGTALNWHDKRSKVQLLD